MNWRIAKTWCFAVAGAESGRPIRAGSAAAPHARRARPVWSRGHSSRDRTRETLSGTSEIRPAHRPGSIDPHRSCFLRGRDQDRRPKCRLAASPTHPSRARPPHKARRRLSPAPRPTANASRIVVRLRPDEFANVGMQVVPDRRSVVDHRIDQMLEGKFRPRPFAGIKRGARRETAAAAFALDTDPAGVETELTGIRVQPDKHRVNVLHRRRVRCFRREAVIHGIYRASQFRCEEPVLDILHLWCAHDEASAVDMHDDGKRCVGPDRAICQNADGFRAERALDVGLAGHDVGQIRFCNGIHQRERINATPRQSFGGERHLWR